MNKPVLDLYSDYLLCSFGQTTATGLSQLLQGSVSHDKITRFLAEETFTSAQLWQMVKPLVRKVQTQEAVLIIDDSIEEKPFTDENELVTWHYSHTSGTTVKGINFLTALYYTGTISVPVGLELVTKDQITQNPKTGKPTKKSTLTKNERYRKLLEACVQNNLPFRYVLNDVWFASAENMRYVKLDLGKDFVMPLKSNRKLALSLEEKQHGRYQSVGSVSLEPGTRREIYLEQVPFPLTLVKQVFTNKDGSIGILYLVTSDLTLGYDQITAIYQKRWKVEEYHKSVKQNASLAKSPTRTVRTQQNHLFCSLCAYVKLEQLKIKTHQSHFALKTRLYFEAIKSAYSQLKTMTVEPLDMAELA